jgi:hypothetical protein
MTTLLLHSFLEHTVQVDSCSVPFLRNFDNDIAYFRAMAKVEEHSTDLLGSSKNSLKGKPVLIAH